MICRHIYIDMLEVNSEIPVESYENYNNTSLVLRQIFGGVANATINLVTSNFIVEDIETEPISGLF